MILDFKLSLCSVLTVSIKWCLAVGIRCADHVTPLYPLTVGTTIFADRRRPLCRYSSLADWGHGVIFFVVRSTPCPKREIWTSSIGDLREYDSSRVMTRFRAANRVWFFKTTHLFPPPPNPLQSVLGHSAINLTGSTSDMWEMHPFMRHLFHLNHQQLIFDTADCAGYYGNCA
jgi:hypothetical protein